MISVLLSLIPGIEARGASFFLIYSGHMELIPLAIIINFFAVCLFIKLFDKAKIPKSIEHFLEKKTNKKIRKFEKWFQKYGNIILFLLIALPSTGIGAFSGAFIGRIFGLKGKIFYFMMLFSIILSILPVLLIMYGISVLGFIFQI